jgi:hypothetical protein
MLVSSSQAFLPYSFFFILTLLFLPLQYRHFIAAAVFAAVANAAMTPDLNAPAPAAQGQHAAMPPTQGLKPKTMPHHKHHHHNHDHEHDHDHHHHQHHHNPHAAGGAVAPKAVSSTDKKTEAAKVMPAAKPAEEKKTNAAMMPNVKPVEAKKMEAAKVMPGDKPVEEKKTEQGTMPPAKPLEDKKVENTNAPPAPAPVPAPGKRQFPKLGDFTPSKLVKMPSGMGSEENTGKKAFGDMLN